MKKIHSVEIFSQKQKIKAWLLALTLTLVLASGLGGLGLKLGVKLIDGAGRGGDRSPLIQDQIQAAFARQENVRLSQLLKGGENGQTLLFEADPAAPVINGADDFGLPEEVARKLREKKKAEEGEVSRLLSVDKSGVLEKATLKRRAYGANIRICSSGLNGVPLEEAVFLHTEDKWGLPCYLLTANGVDHRQKTEDRGNKNLSSPSLHARFVY